MSDIKNKILICSTNVSFLSPFRAQLEQDFEVQSASTEEIATFLAKDWKPDIAIINGDEMGNLTAALRGQLTYSQLGLIVIAEKEGIFKEEYAFRSGADHFLANFQDYKSLVWRVISLVRKMQGPKLPQFTEQEPEQEKAPSMIKFQGVEIFPHDYLVKSNGQVIKITPLQFKLLVAFITHSDQLLTREWIKENIWDNATISPRSIDAQISKMKKMIPEIGKSIMNIYGQGYILTDDSKSAA